MMKKLLAIMAVAALMGTTGTAMAADSTTVTVEATVLDACTVATDTNIQFGALDPIDGLDTTASDVGGAGAVTVTCTNGTPYSIAGPGSAVAMTLNGDGSTSPITYTPDVPTGPFVGSMNGNNHTIDATVLKTAYLNAPAGSYSGNLTITVTY
jgi:spore coat protein U-like protein